MPGETSEHGPVSLSQDAYILHMPDFLGLKNSLEDMGAVHVHEVDELVS